MFDFEKARKAMVESQIETCGVVDPAVLGAFKAIPREMFVPPSLKTLAYSDQDISLRGGRFLLAPMTHARMLQAAQPKPHEIALDVGCASGYSSAILGCLVSTVIALEDDKTLISSVEKLCENTGVCNVIALEAAHEKGFPKHGPYDLIMVNGACAEMPTVLAGQLAPEGRLLYVHAGSRGRSGAIQIVTKQTGLGKTGFSSYTLFDAYAPYLKGFEPQAKFVFS